MNRFVSHLLAALAVITSTASVASAQQGGSKLTIGAGMIADFAGEADYGRGPDDDLEVTLGIRGHADYEVAQYVSVGGFARFAWWEGDRFLEERNFIFSLGPRIRGQYDYRDFRFYAAAMPGLLISAVDDDNFGAADVDNPAIGFTMSIAPGVEYWFNDKIAAYCEIFGWIGHYFDHDFDNAGGDLDVNMNQVAFNFGIVFAP